MSSPVSELKQLENLSDVVNRRAQALASLIGPSGQAARVSAAKEMWREKSNSPFPTPYENKIQTEEAELRQRCQDLWKALREETKTQRNNAKEQDIHLHSSNSVNLNDANTHLQWNKDEMMFKIQQTKAKLLQSELEMAKQYSLEDIPSTPAITRKAMVIEEMRKTVAEMEETLRFLHEQEDGLENQILRMEADKSQHEELNKALVARTVRISQKLEQMTEEQFLSGNSGAEKYMHSLETKSEILDAESQRLMAELGRFLERFYPSKMRRRRKNDRDDEYDSDESDNYESDSSGKSEGEASRFLPLKTLISSLLNAAVNKPYDPYVRIQPEHYPPYIELLVRSGIAFRHSQNSNFLRLTDFLN